MKIGIAYWSGTGNTESMAQTLSEALKAKGAEVVLSEASSVSDDFFSCDAFALGSPAQGTEEWAPDMEELLSANGDKLSGKKVALFGSYGWGGGEYMNGFKDNVSGHGATVVGEVTCEEAPDADAEANLADLASKLA